MFIDGTATLHNWTETVEVFSGIMNAIVEENELIKITSVSISIVVNSIKSGKPAMDKKTYKALKAEKYPYIKYQLKSYSIQESTCDLTGKLTIAGVSKTIEFNCNYQLIDKDNIEFNGKYSFKMTDFNITPPTAAMGIIKTGDEITFRFKLLFTTSQNILFQSKFIK